MKWTDETEGQCAEILEEARAVFARIPKPHRERIESVCDEVAIWLGGNPNNLGVFYEEHRCIRYIASDIKKLSQATRRGLFAHEFGHACDHAIQSIPNKGEDHEMREERANRYVEEWGFGDDYRALCKESE